MNDIKKIYLIGLLVITLLAFNACQQPGGDVTGSEFMPEMTHSVAYEANTYAYYYNNTWGSKEEYHAMAQPRHPVSGTVARGSAGSQVVNNSTNTIQATQNGAVPYYYGDTEDERTRAINEITTGPFPITDAGLAQGKDLYNIFCGICHGEKGDGAGYLVRDDGGKYPVQPANFLLEEFLAASNGRYYHAIEYGKNLMGNYRDKLSYEERWNVIQYIRLLQAKELKLTYNQFENTLNTYDVPAGDIAIADPEMMEGGHDHDADENHRDDTHEGDSHDSDADHDKGDDNH